MTSTTAQSVVIIGGGPAGLAAAYHLTRQGNRVTLIDRRPLLGGTAISEDARDTAEPFTILGCHRATQALLRSLHPDSRQPAIREIPLEFRLPDNSLVHYPRTSFPGPFHTWVNLLKFSGIPWKERWRLASWVEKLWEGDEQLPADLEQRTLMRTICMVDGHGAGPLKTPRSLRATRITALLPKQEFNPLTCLMRTEILKSFSHKLRPLHCRMINRVRLHFTFQLMAWPWAGPRIWVACQAMRSHFSLAWTHFALKVITTRACKNILRARIS